MRPTHVHPCDDLWPGENVPRAAASGGPAMDEKTEALIGPEPIMDAPRKRLTQSIKSRYTRSDIHEGACIMKAANVPGRWLSKRRQIPFLCIILLAACSSQPPLVGKWKSGSETLHLLEDGTVLLETPRGAGSGVWRSVEGNRFMVTITGMGSLTMTGCHALGVVKMRMPNGQIATWQRLGEDGSLGPTNVSVTSGSSSRSSDCVP